MSNRDRDGNPPAAQRVATHWIRYRFVSTADDYRPIVFPPPGPYWYTGERGDGASTMVAYLPADRSLWDYWPEADEIVARPVSAPQFSKRFACPDWWKAER